MKGYRNFFASLGGLFVYAIVATNETITGMGYVWLGIGLGVILTPRVIKEIFAYIEEIKNGGKKG